MDLIIVNYHYFSDKEYNSGIYPIKPNKFLKQVKAISRYYNFISQNDIIKSIDSNKKLKGRFCLITFDDGLKEQMNAYKLLKINNIPAIFYIPTQPIKNKIVLDVHKLQLIRSKFNERYLLEYIDNKLEKKLSKQSINYAKAQYKYDNIDSQTLKYLFNFELNQSEKKYIINHFFSMIYDNESLFSKGFYMNEDDIKILSDVGMVGNHSHSHEPLGKMDRTAAISDIQESTKILKDITGKTPLSFSYPYGSKAALNSDIPKYIENEGYVFGLSMLRGINTNFKNRFLMNRIDTNDAIYGKSEIKSYFK